MSDKIILGDDGKYRWTYVLDPWKNPAVLRVVLIAVGLSFVLPFLILCFIFALEGNLLNALHDILPIYLIVGLVIALITAVVYYGVCKYYKDRFIMLYEMDEEGITFMRCEDDTRKTQNIGELSAWIGLLTKNYGLIGSGLYVANNESARSKFSKLYFITADQKNDMIALGSFLLYNQIFVEQEDFEFVLNFIETHSGKKARIR